jgi:hypothetical protein
MSDARAGRRLTVGERALAASIFHDAIDYDAVRIHRRKWIWFQPKRAVMAPDGHLWVHPRSDLWSDDYSADRLGLQALFMHEMTHVWQAQKMGRWYLVLMRHPFCRYRYRFIPGWPLERYGLEQQAEIVRHVFLARAGAAQADAPEPSLIEALMRFSTRGTETLR